MRWRGFAAVACAASLWGIAGVVAKLLFTRAITPEAVVGVRLTAGLVLTLLILWAQGRSARLPLRTVRQLIPLGAAMLLSQSMYYFTISLSHVTTAIFLQYTAPALVMTYTAVAQRERLTPAQIGCLAAAIAGGYLLVVGPSGLVVTPAAVATGIASAVGFAGWILIGRARAAGVGPWHMLLYGLGTGAVLWTFYAPPWTAYVRPYTVGEWALLLFIVVFATVVPFALFLYGLRFVGSRAASLTATIEPVVAAVVSAAVLGEAMAGRALVGATLILAAVLLLQAQPAEHPAP